MEQFYFTCDYYDLQEVVLFGNIARINFWKVCNRLKCKLPKYFLSPAFLKIVEYFRIFYYLDNLFLVFFL